MVEHTSKVKLLYFQALLNLGDIKVHEVLLAISTDKAKRLLYYCGKPYTKTIWNRYINANAGKP